MKLNWHDAVGDHKFMVLVKGWNFNTSQNFKPWFSSYIIYCVTYFLLNSKISFHIFSLNNFLANSSLFTPLVIKMTNLVLDPLILFLGYSGTCKAICFMICYLLSDVFIDVIFNEITPYFLDTLEHLLKPYYLHKHS